MTQRPEECSEELVTGDGPARYELTGWTQAFGVVAGVTGRGNGYDLGLASEDPTCRVLERWGALASGLGDGFHSVVVSRQVHASAVDVYGSVPSGLLIRDGLDGHLTRESGLLLCVTVADCVPVYLIEPRSGWIGMLHAGWRGVAGGILESAAERLADLGKVSVADIVMHCGVCICGDCYEVGPEVAHAVTGDSLAGPTKLDLRLALASRARSLGLERVSVSSYCSAHGGERFYSHRASGGKAGRMVAYLGRPMG